MTTLGPGSSGGNAKACDKDPSKKACRGSKFKILGFVVSAAGRAARVRQPLFSPVGPLVRCAKSSFCVMPCPLRVRLH